jgi:hypothetical protein
LAQLIWARCSERAADHALNDSTSSRPVRGVVVR